MLRDRLIGILPDKVRNQLDALARRSPSSPRSGTRACSPRSGPPGVRGLLLQRGKQGVPTKMPAHHAAHFDWSYPSDHPDMADLYTRAKQGQWDSDVHLPWKTSVNPLNPEVPLLPEGYFEWDELARLGVHLDAREKQQFIYSMTSWMLSQFLHGEQGALFAAAQVTEAVQFFDGKLYGSTQVMDEGRHVEVFHRYLDEKLDKLYQINDNLFVIIDSLMTDGRWDMKFLGMQIMVEGLALGAFGTLYKLTKEPLLRTALEDGDPGRGAPRALRRPGAPRAHHEGAQPERAPRARGLGVRDRAPDAQPLSCLRGLRGVVRGAHLARAVARRS